MSGRAVFLYVASIALVLMHSVLGAMPSAVGPVAPARAANLQAEPPVTNVTFPARAAFYYPTFPEAWNQADMNPFSKYEPTLGYYDTGNAAVLEDHIGQMEYAGFDVAIASWSGPDHHSNVDTGKLITAANDNALKIAFYYEDEGVGQVPQATITSDLAYLVNTYGPNPSVAKIDGRIVVFVYNADATEDQTCAVVDKWKAANTVNAYLVMKVFAGFGSCASQPDAWHQYGPANRASNFASAGGYTISAGFDKANETTPRLPRDEAAFATAVRNMIASNAKWQLVISFNKWGDGTGVESTTQFGMIYLDILRNNGVTPPTATPTATATPTSTATATATPTAVPVTNVTFPARAAFYYPWFPELWTFQGITPFSHYEPSLGYYSSADSAVVDAHIAQMQYGNIEVGIASWWGPGSREDRRVPLLLSEAAGTGFRWAFYYEEEGNLNPTAAEISADLTYLETTYGANDAVARVDGRLVVFVYNAKDTSCEVVDRWKQANTINAYLVMLVFPGHLSCANQPDAWHQYSPAQRTSQRTGSFAISPGFFYAAEETPRLERDPATFALNVQQMIASGANWQLVVTFNEWGEGTSVESGTAWASESGFGTYLDILHADGNWTPPATATPTATETPTETATAIPTATDTATPTEPATETPTTTPTETELPTSTPTSTETATNTPTDTATATATSTPAPTSTSAPTNTPAPTSTPTRTPTPVPPVETLFADGFESGNLSKWSTKSGITAQQSIVATGNWAARGASTGSSAAYARAGLGRSLSEVYATTRFRIVSQGANDVTVLTLTTSGNTPIVSLVVTSGGTLGLRRTGSSSVITSSTTVTKGVWHVLQLRAKVNGSSGETEVWLDGVRIGTLSRTLNLGTARFARIEIGERSKTRKFDLVWDDVTATTGPIAVAAVAGIERLAPTASATPFPTATSTVPPIPAPSASATATPTEPPATSTPVPTATSTATEAPPPIVSPVPTETPIPTDTPVLEANRPPVAFAGVDQVLALEDGETQVVAVLDGTASWDPDGEIIAYEWYGIDDFLATGPRLELPLGPGSHIIYLVVRDNDGDYAPDDLTITVLDHRSTGSSATPSASP